MGLFGWLYSLPGVKTIRPINDGHCCRARIWRRMLRKDGQAASTLEIHSGRTNHILKWSQVLAIVRYGQLNLRIELSNCALAPLSTCSSQSEDVLPIIELCAIGQHIQRSSFVSAMYITDDEIHDLVWQFHGS